VLLEANVAPSGIVSAVKVAVTSGHPALDRAALAAVRKWRFQPARRAGVPVAASVQVPVRFRLTD
jgi:protein TonB